MEDFKEVEGKMAEGQDIRMQDIVKSEILKEYKAYLAGRKSPNTVSAYIDTVSRFLDFIKDKEPTPELAKKFLVYLGLKGLTPRSLNRHLSALTNFFRFIGKPISIESYKFQKHLPTPLSEEEIERYIKATRNPFERALVLTLYTTGMRISELNSIKISDIDFKNGFIKVMGKGGKERVVVAPPETLEAIREYLDTRKDTSEFLFPRSRGVYWEKIKKIGERVGLKVYPHLLRHTFGTRWISEGGDVASLKEQLGHSSIATTSIYVHLVPKQIKEKMPKII